MGKVVPIKAKSKWTAGKADARRKALRDSLWADASLVTWDRKTETGWCTVPRTLPLIMTLINLLSPKGTGDASRVYFELWCRAFDGGFVELADEDEHAFASGYITGRGTRSWRERMDVLVDLGFIRARQIGTRKYGCVLLVHPHDVIESLKAKHKVQEAWYGAFLKRIGEIGSKLREH